jgi:5'-nucleotidase
MAYGSRLPEMRPDVVGARADGCHPVDGCQDGTPFYGSVFQYLAANVIDQSTSNPLLPSYEIRKIGRTQLAFIGETLEGTPEIVTPAGVAGLTFLDEADRVNMLVPKLKRQGIEAIVVLLHEGGFQSGPTWLYNTCEGMGGAVVDIANRMDDEVDVIVSGHTHQPYNCTIDGKLVTSASSFGRIITDIDLTIDRDTGEVGYKTARNVIVTRDVAKDPAQTELIAHYNAIAGPIRDRVVGTATADLTRVENAAGETSLGDIIADAQLAATSPTDFGGAVVAFMNPGGIRADIQAGEVTYGELFTVQPFANTMMVKTCTGAQIDAALEQQWVLLAGGTERQRILQVSNGFTYAYDKTKPIGSRVDIASIKINGTPVGADIPRGCEQLRHGWRRRVHDVQLVHERARWRDRPRRPRALLRRELASGHLAGAAEPHHQAGLDRARAGWGGRGRSHPARPR